VLLLPQLALKADGSIVGWGNNASGQATPPAGNDYTAISAGHYHSLGLIGDPVTLTNAVGPNQVDIPKPPISAWVRRYGMMWLVLHAPFGRWITG
jgi:hypothetical protein